MKLVKLSSHEAFKFNPKEFTSCMPKGLALKDTAYQGELNQYKTAPGQVTALVQRLLGLNFKVAQGSLFSLEGHI